MQSNPVRLAFMFPTLLQKELVLSLPTAHLTLRPVPELDLPARSALDSVHTGSSSYPTPTVRSCHSLTVLPALCPCSPHPTCCRHSEDSPGDILLEEDIHSLQYLAPSSAATAFSRQFLVGFPLRLYSKPYWETKKQKATSEIVVSHNSPRLLPGYSSTSSKSDWCSGYIRMLHTASRWAFPT